MKPAVWCFAHFTQIYGSIAHNCRKISGPAIKRCSVFRLIDVQAEQCWIQEVVCRRLTYPSEHQKVPQNILNIIFIDALEMQFPSEFYSVSHLCCRNPFRRKKSEFNTETENSASQIYAIKNEWKTNLAFTDTILPSSVKWYQNSGRFWLTIAIFKAVTLWDVKSMWYSYSSTIDLWKNGFFN